MGAIRRMVVTTDLSETSEQVFDAARELAERFDAQVILTHVTELRLPYQVIENYSAVIEDAMEDERGRARDQLFRYAAEYFVPHVDVEVQLLTGVPHTEIVRLAKRCGADLIVMATHGRGFMSHALLGSTTERVVRRAPCPVFVVRAAKQKRITRKAV